VKSKTTGALEALLIGCKTGEVPLENIARRVLLAALGMNIALDLSNLFGSDLSGYV
jgi:hypothetical protein